MLCYAKVISREITPAYDTCDCHVSFIAASLNIRILTCPHIHKYTYLQVQQGGLEALCHSAQCSDDVRVQRETARALAALALNDANKLDMACLGKTQLNT